MLTPPHYVHVSVQARLRTWIHKKSEMTLECDVARARAIVQGDKLLYFKDERLCGIMPVQGAQVDEAPAEVAVAQRPLGFAVRYEQQTFVAFAESEARVSPITPCRSPAPQYLHAACSPAHFHPGHHPHTRPQELTCIVPNRP